MNWDETIQRFVEQYMALGHKPGSGLSMRNHLGFLMRFCLERGLHTPREVTESDIAVYQQVLRWQPSSKGTLRSESCVMHHLQAVRTFFRWATDHQHVLLDPTRNL